MEKKYNVYVVSDKSGKAVSLIGRNLTESRADKREETGLGRIDQGFYFVEIAEVGSSQDELYQVDIN